MASVDDIDAKQSVGKFLQTQSVTPPADSSANTADEINAVLATVATAFLLYPQAALTLIMNAKNSLQQVVQADQLAINFMMSAILDINNKDIPITSSSDLVDAQTALVELDRLGRVDSTLQSFNRYKIAINNFLNNQLAPTLKRNGTGTFERTGDEARQDLSTMLTQFVAVHGVMISLLKSLENSISDFRSVNLTSIVSSTTISRVRASLNRVKTRVDLGTISKTTAAIELLSGSASLTSISNTGDIFDPAVQTGSLPTNTNISFLPQDIKAIATSTTGPWIITGGIWKFIGIVDPLSTSIPFNFEIPGPGVSNRVYVSSEGIGNVLNIPSSGTLYINFQGASSIEIEATISSGPSVPLTTVIANINSALGTAGSCIKNPGIDGIIIFGSASTTAITIRTDSTGAAGTVSTHPSIHQILGFSPGQTSNPLGQFTAESLFLAVKNQLPNSLVSTQNNTVSISSQFPNSPLSSLFFDSSSSNALFGFSGAYEASPAFFQLIDDSGVVLSPGDMGVYVGSVVTMEENPPIPGSSVRTLNNQPIVDIQGTQIFLDPLIPVPRRGTFITIICTIVSTVQQLIQGLPKYIHIFDQDTTAIQRALSPIVSNPTNAQIGDAKRIVQGVIDKLQTLLDFLANFTIRPDQTQFSSVASQIISSLEERGLDRAQELLSSGQFSQFFSLDSTNASKSNRLLTAMESVTTQDLPVSNLEVDIDDDLTPRGTNPDSSVLAGSELQGSGTLVTNN